jgi:hypothetical protein
VTEPGPEPMTLLSSLGLLLQHRVYVHCIFMSYMQLVCMHGASSQVMSCLRVVLPSMRDRINSSPVFLCIDDTGVAGQ